MTLTREDLPLGCGLRLEASDKKELLEAGKAEVIGLLSRHRALVFRAPEVTPDEFVTFSDRFGPPISGYLGGSYVRKKLDENPEILSVTGGGPAAGIPLHSELHYTKNPPDILWLHCVTEPKADGETTLCDGVGFAEALAKSTSDLFRTKRISYRRAIARELWPSIFEAPDVESLRRVCHEQGLTLKIEDDGSVTTEFCCYAIKRGRFSDAPAFTNNILTTILSRRWEAKHPRPPGPRDVWTVCMEDGSEISDEIVDELVRVARARTHPYRWRKGDIMMIDNSSMLHGRGKLSCDVRKIGVRQSALLVE